MKSVTVPSMQISQATETFTAPSALQIANEAKALVSFATFSISRRVAREQFGSQFIGYRKVPTKVLDAVFEALREPQGSSIEAAREALKERHTLGTIPANSELATAYRELGAAVTLASTRL